MEKNLRQPLPKGNYKTYFQEKLFYTIFKKEKNFLKQIGYFLFFQNGKVYLYQKSTGRLATLTEDYYLTVGDVSLYLVKENNSRGRMISIHTDSLELAKIVDLKTEKEEISGCVVFPNTETMNFEFCSHFLSTNFLDDDYISSYDLTVSPRQNKFSLEFDNLKKFSYIWNEKDEYFWMGGMGFDVGDAIKIENKEIFLRNLLMVSQSEEVKIHLKNALYALERCLPGILASLKQYPILGSYQDILEEVEKEVGTEIKVYKKKK